MKKSVKSLILKITIPLTLIIILNLIFLSENAAEFFSVYISRYINIALGAIFSIFGTFSVSEWIFTGLIVSVAVGILAVIVCLLLLKFVKAGKLIMHYVSIALFIVLTITLTMTSGYSRKTIDAPLNLTLQQLDVEKARNAALYYRDELFTASGKISRDENGNIETIDFKELNRLLNLEYSKLDKKYFTDYNFKAKKVVMSPLLTYFSISGMYFPLTGEANISTTCPNYQLPVIMAHELAHSRGVMREDEANFLAYYVCINSENSYLNYCGLLYASSGMINAVYIYDEAGALAIRNSYPEEINTELKNGSEFYKKYDNKFLTDVSEFFNNLWLKSNKVSDGTKSYSRTAVRLYALYENLN